MPYGPPVGSPGHLLPLRALGVGDVLDGAIRILRRGFGVVAAIIVLVYGPYQLLTSLLLDRLMPEFATQNPFGPLDQNPFGPMGQPEIDVELLQRLVLFGGTAAIVGLLIHVLVGGAFVAAALELDHGRTPRAGAVLRRSLQVSGGTLGATVLTLLGAVVAGVVVILVAVLLGAALLPVGILVGVAALPLLGAVVAALLYLVLPIAVAEESGPLRTLARAWWVLRRRFWWVLGVTALAFLMVVALTFAVQLVFMLLTLVAGPAAFVVEAVAGTLSALVSVPVTVGAALLIYQDARVRGEGYDLRARAPGQPWG